MVGSGGPGNEQGMKGWCGEAGNKQGIKEWWTQVKGVKGRWGGTNQAHRSIGERQRLAWEGDTQLRICITKQSAHQPVGEARRVSYMMCDLSQTRAGGLICLLRAPAAAGSCALPVSVTPVPQPP